MKLLSCKNGKKKMRMITRRCEAFVLALLMALSGTFFIPENVSASTDELTWVDGSTVETAKKGTAYYFDLASTEMYATAGTYGLMTVATGSKNALQYKNTTYGLAAKEGNNFTIKVAGNSYIVVSGDNNSAAGATITASSGSGQFENYTLATRTKGHCDLEGCKSQGDNSVSFLYVGNPGEVTLTLNGSTAYICAICVIPAADDIVISKYEQKSFSLNVGTAVVSVTSGAAASDNAVVTVENGECELATADTAIIWADLNGGGSGTLSQDMLTNLSDNITASVSGNVITVTYNDTSTTPTGYKLIVKDNSASGVPAADGTPISYSFTDGSILSALYGGSNVLTGGKSVSSSDKLVTLIGNTKLYYNGSHGIVVNDKDAISVKVAGDATISISLCQHSGDGSQLVVSGVPENGKVSVNGEETLSADAKAAVDGDAVTFEYSGDAAELVFTYSASGTGYIHSMTVTNKAKASEENTQTKMPEIKSSYGTAGSMTATPVGQRLIISQNGGSLKTTDGAIDSSVSYYGFESTADYNRLEADVVVNSCGASNYNGVFFGAFDEKYIATLAVRNNTGLRGIYSKSSSDMAGAGGVNTSVIQGQKIHFTAEKKDGNFVITALPENGEASAMTYNYGDSKMLLFKENGKETTVSFGFVVANASVTVTNMKYYGSNGELLYDQNDCYEAVGTIPVIAEVKAQAAESRENITVSWNSSVEADGDGRYVVFVSTDKVNWTQVAQTTDKIYTYPVSEAGSYWFKVCGQLGVDGECNDGVISDEVSLIAALSQPVVSADASENGVTVKWEAVEKAQRYELYRYSYDEGEEAVRLLANITDLTYTDNSVELNMPYYYYVIAYSDDNNSNPSETAWAVPAAARNGEYVHEDEAAEIIVTKKSYDTVFSGEAVLEGIVLSNGEIAAYVNDNKIVAKTVSEGDDFSFTLPVDEGRNDVELIFTDKSGNKTRKAYNIVYLTAYDMVVDSQYTGEDGQTVDGIPTYSTVSAAVSAVPADNTQRKVILVLAGSYEERLVVTSPYISLVGEDREETLVHCYPGVLGTDYEAGGDMAKRCATYIQKTAKGFTAENISFANDYVYSTADGKSNKSADALRCDADGSEFINVKFSSVQDTLYMGAGHQYYDKCRIEGLIDFIYSGDDARSLFNDCEIVYIYESTKNSGYICAPRTAKRAAYGLIFNNCVITAEEGCSGTGYMLARPWGADAYITWINCYMGKVINATLPYAAMSQNEYANARFYESGTYGPGYLINNDRRQISENAAKNMLTDTYLEWSPETAASQIAAGYKGNVFIERPAKYVTAEYESDRYLSTDGDDTGLGKYALEGYAQAYGVTGGGLLKPESKNYYKVSTAEEFLTALTAIKTSGSKSVIELTADINLGCNEISNFDSYSKVIKAYTAQPLTHPTLIDTGVSVLMFDGFANVTIFSSNGSSIKHANITMKNSSNIIIRNIKFDELWEWDEETDGNYDRNDWDYMTIDSACNGIWIDHCTFYKAYDGVIDVKNPSPEANVTISWCEFLPGSEDDIFFDVMMNELSQNVDKYPYYQHLLDEGMTESQIRGYAYGQKKTHLFGQSDTATNAAGIKVTLANNYYYNSMDRMPRLRYGYTHVYNCIMDAQELRDTRKSIANETIAQKIVSNGASSTCGAHVLLENCYINGIENALNSGNGSSPSGYINAVNSLYYLDGVKTTLEPKCNSTGDTRVLVTDAEEFVSALPYSDYTLYAADKLDSYVKPYTGAGKLELTVLQWEKARYNDTKKDDDGDESSSESISESTTEKTSESTTEKTSESTNESTSESTSESTTESTTESTAESTTEGTTESTNGDFRCNIGTLELDDNLKKLFNVDTIEALEKNISNMFINSEEAKKILGDIEGSNIKVVDIVVQMKDASGNTWTILEGDKFPSDGVDIVIPYPEGTNKDSYDFVIGHLITTGVNGGVPGTMEFFVPEKLEEGLKIHITSASPFVIGWKPVEDNQTGSYISPGTGYIQDAVCSMVIILILLGAAGMIIAILGKKKILKF